MEPFPDSSLTHFMTLEKSLYLSGPPCPHLVLPFSLRFQTFVFLLFKPYRRAILEGILVLEGTGISQVKLCK